jgi:hypothetical protein
LDIQTYNVLRGPGWRLLGIAMPEALFHDKNIMT